MSQTARDLDLFATHYHELNEMSQRFRRQCECQREGLDGNIVFLRKLAAGGHHSFGIHGEARRHAKVVGAQG